MSVVDWLLKSKLRDNHVHMYIKRVQMSEAHRDTQTSKAVVLNKPLLDLLRWGFTGIGVKFKVV